MNEIDDVSAIEASAVTGDASMAQNLVAPADATISDIAGMNTGSAALTDNIGEGIDESIICAAPDGCTPIDGGDVAVMPPEDVLVTGDGDGSMQNPEYDASVSSDGNTNASDASKPSFGSRMKHLYCPVCGHTWYSPDWPSYCPKSGCLGRPQEM